MKISSKRGSSLFLMELILVLFFFLIAAACCIQMFVKAWLLSEKASELNQAENCARNVAEVLESSDDFGESMIKFFPEMKKEGNQYLLYYDKDWKVCDKKENHYQMELTLDSDMSQVTGQIIVKDKKEIIYQLDVVKHIPKRSGGESR